MLSFFHKRRLVVCTIALVVILCGLLTCYRFGNYGSKAYADNAASQNVIQQSAVPTAEFIAAALRDQASVAVVARWQAATGSQCDYTRTNGVLFLKKTHPDNGAIERISYDRNAHETRRLTTMKGIKPQGSLLTSRIGSPFDTYDLVDGVFLVLYDGSGSASPLYERIAIGEVLPEMEDVDGYRCWRVELRPRGGNTHHVVWLDPEIGFWPRRVEVISDSGTSTPLVIMYADFKEISAGYWFPMKEMIHPSTAAGSPPPVCDKGFLTIVSTQSARASWSHSVTEIKSSGEIPKDSLVVRFPKGTRVFLNESNIPIIAP